MAVSAMVHGRLAHDWALNTAETAVTRTGETPVSPKEHEQKPEQKKG